jgi:hypothetical protein
MKRINVMIANFSVAIGMGLVIWNSLPAAQAQGNTPAPPTEASPPPLELKQAPSYIGFGGVIGLQGLITRNFFGAHQTSFNRQSSDT